MKLLIELTRIANLKRVSKIEIFDAQSTKNKTSKFNAFYDALSSDKLRTDRDAAKMLYNTSPADDRYRQLKSRFRRRLLNTVFFLNVTSPIKPRYEQAYADCQRDWALVNILSLYDAEQSVPYLSRQLLSAASKYHFTSIMVQSVRLLMQIATSTQDIKEHERLQQLLEIYLPMEQAEIEAETLFQNICLKKDLEPEGLSTSLWNAWRERFIQLSEHHPTPRTQYLAYLVGSWQYMAEGRFDLVLSICQQAERMLNANPDYFPQDSFFSIRYLLIQVFLQTGDFSAAREHAEKIIPELEPGSQEWLNYLDIYYLVAVKSENYTHAYAILQRLLSLKQFNKLDAPTKEKWQLYKVALYYLLFITPDSSRLLQSKLYSNFQITHFLEDVALFPKERRIYTVWTLILQVLFLLEQNEDQAIDEIMDRLKQYTRKQLHPVRHERIIEFIRCLGYLSKSGFDGSKIKVDNKYYLRLLSLPLKYNGNIDQLEIIPFPTLWGLIHKRLKRSSVGPMLSI